ncbi:MAG: FmdE family protein [Chloroflexota bacterium]
MKPLPEILEQSAAQHSHLCPRQVLGARLGLYGLQALGFDEPPAKKRLLVISETDGCFADGLSAAAGCTVGHRTLRVEDYGKTAAVFVDTLTGQAVRAAPALDLREQAYAYAPGEPRHYFAQLQGYQMMPAALMFTLQPVLLKTPIAEIISRPGLRVCCERCGEEIMNERQVQRGIQVLCRACAGGAYYRVDPLAEAVRYAAPAYAAHALSAGD